MEPSLQSIIDSVSHPQPRPVAADSLPLARPCARSPLPQSFLLVSRT